jgi:hypothetical protein
MFSARSASGCGPDSIAMNAPMALWKLGVVNRSGGLRPTPQCLSKGYTIFKQAASARITAKFVK